MQADFKPQKDRVHQILPSEMDRNFFNANNQDI